ncbi:DNA repair protein RadC [Planococcus sp. APC 3906]|uniref:RadC family protein n=1 Tax=Planococcus sp. APC 3906 TaxID=3035194 RepID=UPI0025B3D3A0|nr:DNA repair protein RadC [Planococcus sp. APC 3906]MDN3451091.1 DNA repair protein RadC [Planococcus sp. APC 3906]
MTTAMNKNEFKGLLAGSIKEKEDGYVVSELFSRYPSVQEMLDVTEDELLSIKGIGQVKAKQIISALMLARMNLSFVQERFTIRSPKDAYDYLRDMEYLTQEHFVVLGLNIKNQVLFRQTVFIGSLNACIVHPSPIFQLLIKRNCASAIVAHNHPSGNPAPSQEDIQVTKRLMEAGNLMGVEILDHIIVGTDTYISLNEKGYM